MKKYGQKKVSDIGDSSCVACSVHNRPTFQRVKITALAFWDVLRYPLLCVFVASLSMQLMYVFVAFGFFAMMGYVAMIALPLAYIIKKREDNSFKCLYGQKA